MKMYSKHLIKATVLGIISIIILNLILSQKYISVTRYEYKNPRITEDFRVVHLTDLHNYQFGTKNRRLVEKVREETPDLIFLTGDMLNEDETRTDICIDLVEKLVKIAPVYVSLGNHEIEYMNRVGNNNLISEIEQAGAVVLNEQYIDMEVNGVPVRLGGVYGYVLAPDKVKNSEQAFMEEFQDTDRFKILLSHVPEGLLLWKSMEYWDVDLVFSGHVHGGQVRLPFIGGLFDPEEGLFPTYTKGMFKCGNGTMILSAGLGSSRGRLRINNFPEMVVCEIGK